MTKSAVQIWLAAMHSQLVLCVGSSHEPNCVVTNWLPVVPVLIAVGFDSL